MTIVFAGSSSMAPGSPLPEALARALGVPAGAWIALGRDGARLRDWIEPTWPEGLRASAIVMLLTGNDLGPRADDVRAVDQALRARAPIVVWLPPLPYPAGSPVHGRDRRMRDALSLAGVARVELAVALSPGHFAPDRVHLTRGGYDAFARQLAPALRQALGVREALASAPPMGWLVTPRGERLPLTSTDALWMARALEGEGGGEADARAITSTMLRRWALLLDGGERAFGTLTDLVVGRLRGPDPYDAERGEVALRGYSQPVAVQWRAEAGERGARRARIRSLAWDAIAPVRRRAGLELVTGRAPLTAAPAIPVAERSVVERRMREFAGWRLVAVPGAANVFVSTESSRRMREPIVLGADRAHGPAPLVAGAGPASVPAPVRARRGGFPVIAGPLGALVLASIGGLVGYWALGWREAREATA